MRRLKVLHITSWFPNPYEEREALWIKRHIDALGVHCEKEVWHIRTYEGGGFSNYYRSHGNRTQWLIRMNLRRWRLIEWVTFFQLLWLGITRRKSIQSADVLNVHIAYPLLRHWSLLRRLYPRPLVVTEHWSAYHYQFNIRDEATLRPMQQIFSHPDLLIGVSEALLKDIRGFAKKLPENTAVVPNVVDTEVFNHSSGGEGSHHIFMVSQWKHPKDPFTVLRVFCKIADTFENATLKIGGYGPQMEEIRALIEELGLGERITLAGRMTPEEIAAEMNRSAAFVHLSDYETFSVVCAEALCCGCPVIASGVGGIKSYLRDGVDGILIDGCDSDELETALKRVFSGEFSSTRSAISAHAREQFSPAKVGVRYAGLLERVVREANGSD